MPMHPALQVFFDEHEAKTATHRRAINSTLDPLAEIYAAALKHVLDLELGIEKAQRAIDDQTLVNNMEMLHTRVSGLRTELEALKTHTRKVVKRMAEVDLMFGRDKHAIDMLTDPVAFATEQAARVAPDPALRVAASTEATT